LVVYGRFAETEEPQVFPWRNAMRDVGSFECDALAPPIGRTIVDRFNQRVQWGTVIRIESLVGAENRIGNWLGVAVVSNANADLCGLCFGERSGLEIFYQAKTVVLGTITT
jgi:hypothetical protein